MQRKIPTLMIVLCCSAPLASQAAPVAQIQQPPRTWLPSETMYPYVVGLGAIAGVVATQALLFGSAGFPFFAGSVAVGSSIAPAVSVGISRMYAVTSAVVGAWIANWIYDHPPR